MSRFLFVCALCVARPAAGQEADTLAARGGGSEGAAAPGRLGEWTLALRVGGVIDRVLRCQTLGVGATPGLL